MAQQLPHVQHGTDRDRRARERNENQRPVKILHLAEDDVSGAMQDIADGDGALIGAETDARAQPVGEGAAAQQPYSRAAPHFPDARRSAVEYDLAEEAEQ